MKQRNVIYDYSALQDLTTSRSLTIPALARRISINPESLAKKLVPKVNSRRMKSEKSYLYSTSRQKK